MRKIGQQAMGRPEVAHLPRHDREGEDAACTVDDEGDLGAPPAVERCAFAVGLPISCDPPGVASTKAVSLPAQMPRPGHRW